MKVFVAWLIRDMVHGFAWMETSETEYEHNGERERTAENNFIARFWNFAQNKNFALLTSRPQRPVVARNDITAKKIVSGLFQNL